jgi:hypothetical protein
MTMTRICSVPSCISTSYPDNETLTTIFDDLLVSAVMHTQDVDEDDAAAADRKL